ncbi:amino acid synthesis family protein [Leucobacter soli]|uniref:amino acid synthesis family protein n=1 Tax=Leucobacter soli TaxID=2812850 RepID=UPI00360A2E73
MARRQRSTGHPGSLRPEVERMAPDLAFLLTQILIDLLGGVDAVVSFGKGAIVGVDGEREHGAAFQHTAFFGNVVRDRLGATQIISSTDVRGPAGTLLSAPMGNKLLGGRRDFFESMPVWVDEAPQPDEIALILVGSTGPRPNARIGDRTTDPKVTLDDYASHPLYPGKEQ